MLLCAHPGCDRLRHRSIASGKVYDHCRDHSDGSHGGSSTTDAAEAAAETATKETQ